MTKTPRWFLSVSASVALLSGFACQGGGTNNGKSTGGSGGGITVAMGGSGHATGSQGGTIIVGSGGTIWATTSATSQGGGSAGGQASSSGSGGSSEMPDAGASDVSVKDTADAPANDLSRGDTQEADRPAKPPLDGLAADTSPRQPVDTGLTDSARICVAGERRCNQTVLQTCSPGEQYWDSHACDYACRDNACVGDCDPGVRRRCRATGNVPQACDSTSNWADEPACSGSTPYCATGQCVAACLTEGQDCSAANTACCAGTECIAANNSYDIHPGSGTFVCKAIPACAALGATCSANTDCCAGLDCTAGKCAAKQTACMDKTDDGECNPSGNTCCPGTECTRRYSFETLGCTVPTTTKPKEIACPREQPAFHEACHADKLGLECGYTPGATQPGLFFRCLCSYHGWSCSKNYLVH
jgi:hypothetical protein